MNNQLAQIASHLTYSFKPDDIAFALSTAYNARSHLNQGESRKTLKKIATLFARVIGHSLDDKVIEHGQEFPYRFNSPNDSMTVVFAVERGRHDDNQKHVVWTGEDSDLSTDSESALIAARKAQAQHDANPTPRAQFSRAVQLVTTRTPFPVK